MTALTIGRFADEMGVPVDTVRYYERRGLLPPPERTSGGYRTYGDEERSRLSFILRAKALGFTLGEIAELVGGVVSSPEDAGAVRAAAIAKLEAVEKQRQDLLEVRARLQQLVRVCDDGDDLGCASLRMACGP